MSNLLTVLERRPTQEQEELLVSYPQKAIEKAIAKLQRRGGRKSFNYFLAVVKDEAPPEGSVTATKKEVQVYIRDVPEEDPMEAVTKICNNLIVTTVDKRGFEITPRMKQQVALKDPWFGKLTTQQKTTILTHYPFYSAIVGLRKQQVYWQQLHDVMMKD